MVKDSDENPSAKRIAGWTADVAEFGLLGIGWAILVGLWARRRSRGK